MNQESLSNLGFCHRRGLPNFIRKIKNNQTEITLGFLGGSITNTYGYKNYFTDYLKKIYKDIQFNLINAGISGTDSLLGVARIEKDVLIHEPDIVIVEFSVNDRTFVQSNAINTLEGMIRKIPKWNPYIDIIFVYTMSTDDIPTLLSGKFPTIVSYHETIAEYYDIPSVHLGIEVANLYSKGHLLLEASSNKVEDGKIIFGDDKLHPGKEVHKIYAQAMINAYQIMSQKDNNPLEYYLKPKYNENNFYDLAKLIDPSYLQLSGSWKKVSPNEGNHLVDKYFSYKPNFEYMYIGTEMNDSITFSFIGTQVGIYGVRSFTSGSMTVTINDKVHDLTIYSGQEKKEIYFRHFFEKLPYDKYTVTFKTNPKINDKVGTTVYLGKIIIVGNLT